MNAFDNKPEPLPAIAHEPEPARTLPIYTSSAADASRLFHEQRLVIERRAEHARARLANRRQSSNSFPKSRNSESELDPVLRSHLGLD